MTSPGACGGPGRIRAGAWGAVLLALLALSACKVSPQQQHAATAGPVPAAATTSMPDPQSPPQTRVIVMLGDSLTAGLGLPEEQSYPALIRQRLQAGGYAYRVVNAGVSGDTSAGGLARLDWVLRQRVDILLVALGANDGLRGLSTAALRDNLRQIIERARQREIQVVLAGMRMPTNYGAAYRGDFERAYAELARQYELPFIPFLLEGVAMRADLNQADGIHPNAQGAERVADTVWAVLQPLLEQPR